LWQKAEERALRTARIAGAAEIFAGVDDEGVKFVEEPVIGGKGRFEQIANFFVTGEGVREVVAFEDAAGVDVNDKNGMLAGVEKNGVGGFRANAAKG